MLRNKTYRGFYGRGQVCASAMQTSVRFRDFEEQYLCQFLAIHFQIWQFGALSLSSGVVDCKTVSIFAYSSTREQSNKRSGTRLKIESEIGERRACGARALRARRTLTPRFTDFFTDFEKKPTVLQSSGVDRFSLTCLCQKLKNTMRGSITPFMSSMCQLWTH